MGTLLAGKDGHHHRRRPRNRPGDRTSPARRRRPSSGHRPLARAPDAAQSRRRPADRSRRRCHRRRTGQGVDQLHGGAIRQARRHRQQRWHPHSRHDPGRLRGGLPEDVRRQRQGRVPRIEVRHPRTAQGRRRVDRQLRVDQLDRRREAADHLHRQQGSGSHAHQSDRPRLRRPGHPRQHGVPRFRRHPAQRPAL